MKRFIYLILLLAVLVGCTQEQKNSAMISVMSDESVNKEILEAVDAVNASCPVQVDERTTLIRASFEDKVWQYHYSLNEDSVLNLGNTNFINPMKEGMKTAVRKQVVRSENMKSMVEALIKTGSCLSYEYRGNTSGVSFSFTFSNDELKEMQELM